MVLSIRVPAGRLWRRVRRWGRPAAESCGRAASRSDPHPGAASGSAAPYLILNFSAVLQAPAPALLLARTFHFRASLRGSFLVHFQEVFVRFARLKSSLLPL